MAGTHAAELLTKRTKVVTPEVSIGDRTDPTDDGTHALAESARRLVDAVKPHLTAALDHTVALADEGPGADDRVGLDPSS